MTTEYCQRAATIDVVAFLDEPQRTEWEEFRQHATQCEDCSAAVAQWTQLDKLLRAAGTEATILHPPVEQLAQYEHDPQGLSAEVRRAVEQHLQRCRSCAEEVSFVKSFDFARVQEGLAEERGGRAAASRPSVIIQMFDGLRALVLHPAFAYSIALLLCIPLVRSSSLLHPSGSATSIPEAEQTLTEVLRSPSRSPRATGQEAGLEEISALRNPQEAALAFLLHDYKAAYEARDIGALGRVWPMSEEWRGALTRLFAQSRHIALLVDIDEQALEVKENGQRVLVPFAQAVTVVAQAGHFTTKGPFFCVADLRLRDAEGWVLQDLQDDPHNRGQCRPQELK